MTNVRAITSFIVEHDGVQYVMSPGEVLAGSHPVVKAHAELFEPAVLVEAASASPGEKRNR